MSFDIYNVEGRLIKSGIIENTTNNQQTIDINNLISGFYYLQLTNEKYRFVLKFIKEKNGI